MRYNPINNYIMAVQTRSYGGCDLSTSATVLLRIDCALSAKVLEVRGARGRALCALCARGCALCARVMRCRRSGVEAWWYGAPEVRCRLVDAEAWRYGCMELWKSVAGVQTWKYGGLEVRCRCSEVKPWRRGGM